MNGINSIGGPGAASQVTTQQPGLGKDDFLKMLLAQLKNQDPLNPQSDPQFMGTMAQFTALEQTTNLVKAFEQSNWSSQVSQSVALIGKNVTWSPAEGQLETGVVTSVTFDEGEITIHVGEQIVQPGSIRSIG